MSENDEGWTLIKRLRSETFGGGALELDAADRIEYLESQDEIHWRTRRSLLIAIEELHQVLMGLYQDNIDYLTLNNLGGTNNHWLMMARKVLKIEPDWVDSDGKVHAYRCGLNPDPKAMKHMVNYCTCESDKA